STIQNHADALGRCGTYQEAHQVYGRGGEPCVTCGAILKHALCAQRSTVFCSICQPKKAR
ncbi:MAG: DNA-formamidopyrimidine glycosylase, partial [Betaproteobacteria bacterium]|nr:DNA-formamidopyrimidine glycosylase [Betaproteobacteria bacterium]